MNQQIVRRVDQEQQVILEYPDHFHPMLEIDIVSITYNKKNPIGKNLFDSFFYTACCLFQLF